MGMGRDEQVNELKGIHVRVGKASQGRRTVWYLYDHVKDHTVNDAAGKTIGYHSKKLASRAAAAYAKTQYGSDGRVAVPRFD